MVKQGILVIPMEGDSMIYQFAAVYEGQLKGEGQDWFLPSRAGKAPIGFRPVHHYVANAGGNRLPVAVGYLRGIANFVSDTKLLAKFEQKMAEFSLRLLTGGTDWSEIPSVKVDQRIPASSDPLPSHSPASPPSGSDSRLSDPPQPPPQSSATPD